MGRRIGFLLANVYQGASRAMWRYAAVLAKEHPDDSLIIFPGGRLGFLGSSEYLRNSIYDLVDSSSIDGALIWSSSLTGAEGLDNVISFVKGIADHLPVVSMCMTIPGIPSVDFDAYTGIYSAVKHFITIHSKTKIAFIRGPRNHKSAEARYKAYLDALSDSGIPINEELITTPRSWSDGAAAARELILERKLKAGEDFEAVVAASDLLLLGADSIFRENDISIPEAIIMLRQGVGRLVRTESDTGALIVMDPRLQTKKYGASFFNSLPPMHCTTSFRDLTEFLHKRKTFH